MAVTSTTPSSRRGYLSQDELEQFANITVTDTDEADDVISQAEEMIDSFVGYQQKFLEYEILGRATAGGSATITLETEHQNVYEANFFKLCEIEIVDGTGSGQRRRVSASTKAGVLTVASAWTTTPDSTSFYRIHQLGKFPRYTDVITHLDASVTTYYKSIPEAVRRAVAAQVEYIINQGDEFFTTDQSDKTSESIGDYSYSMGEKSSISLARMIAPKAKLLLRGYINRTGRIINQ
ncbi:MAG: hypothetical protein WC871_02335 [Bacteroidales bacterium]|jgi:hypothetical protein